MGFVWAVSEHRAQNRFQERYEAQLYADRAQDRVDRSCAGREGTALTECITEIVNSTREAERAEYDLSAQREMADWALVMMFVSIATFAISTVALWFIKGTLDATRDAVGQAQDGTQAALIAAQESKVANKIARWGNRRARHNEMQNRRDAQIAERRQLRAYMTAQNVQASQIGSVSSPKWEIQIIWANNGSTPAVAAIANTNSQLFDGDIPDDFIYIDNPTPSQHSPLPVGPHQILYSRAPFLSGGDVAKIQRGTHQAFVWGWIEYQDIFSRDRNRTEFCYKLGIEFDGKSFGMAFIPYGPHNGMDQGCMKKPSN